MPSLRLTRRAVDEVPYPKTGQIFYRDTLLTGFGLRVGANSKSFYAEGQVNRRTRRVTIGRADVFAPEIARKKALVILGEMAEGRDPNAEKRKEKQERVTLEMAFNRFFEARNTLSPHTISNYRRSEQLYLKQWHKKEMKEITRQMVLKKHQNIGKKHGKTTANNVMRHFRSVYNFISATLDDFPPNPVQILTQARAWFKERRRQTVVTAVDLPAWWKAVMAEPDYSRDFLLTALFTGMRRSEVMQLRWENVDLSAKTLHLPTTKNGDPLTLPLSEFLADLLTQRRETNRNSPWVFPGPGRTGHLVETKKFLLRVSAGSGVSFTLHDLRRTFITIAESLDVPYYALKRLLNHRTNGDVTGGYIVVNAERLREPVELVAKRILELKEPRD
ncbi:tyrosine-type recombinase/integrase [Aliiroseovarius crassostreae]|uniref:tyrosine-type recombinase/integrase n=1 Tax=Aliiroseovarius crassostreae TaxID=154981 RepID=UPI0021AFFD81|nr:integrase family protein [Aliiroseovarius crassostreae]UWQ11027.1 tyrosine-type recombinase/integrase [Aliiroseovarius crassostreae]